MDIAVIGAGLGGLSAACLLASKGHNITVFEKNSSPGGKINQVKADGFTFDTGPSLLTMPGVLKSLFSRCGRSTDDYLSIKPVDPICRYFYPDGGRFDCHQDSDSTLTEVNRIAPQDVEAFKKFRHYAEQLYQRTNDAFLFNPLYNFRDIQSLNLTDIFKIDALQTVSNRVDSRFKSTYMRQFFKRFSTYNGSSPFQAPATLNVIPHIELNMGGFYLDGGMYTLVEALMHLANNLGVSFHFDAEVEAIEISSGTATGIKVAGSSISADLIIANSDATETYCNLVPSRHLSYIKQKKLEETEPSCSGLVLLLGIDKSYAHLSHHNIFFSSNYRREFDDIFAKKVMPDDPTIYVANTAYQNSEHAIEGGSNLFILVNAPYLSNSWNWKEKEQHYPNFIINELEKRGLNELRSAIKYQHQITPVDFYERYRSNKGSIYGTSSNSKMAAFMRPKNKTRNIEGLYLVGGSTHPGGGIPLVILSAFNAVELIERYES